MSENQQEARLAEIRRRQYERKEAFATWKARDIIPDSLPVPDMITDIDDLLSLLQQPASERCAECGHERRFFYLDRKRDSDARCWHEEATDASSLVVPGNRDRAIALLRQLRETTDPAEVARQKESWATLEADLRGVATTGVGEGTERWATVKSTCNFCGQNVKHVCTAFLKDDTPATVAEGQKDS